MKILIIEEGKYLLESKSAPIVGRKYILEDVERGTAAQNKAAHALMQEYFKSGLFSDNADTWQDLRNRLKIRLGQGFESFVYIDPDDPYKIQDAETWELIPVHVKTDPQMKDYIRGRVKSWSDYTLKQRRDFIDNLIAEMHTVGVQSKKFYEILEGMEK